MVNKKTVTYIISSVSLFFAGMEYAVIFPTLNQFLLYINAPSSYLGLILSAMSISSLLSSLVYGRIADVTKKTKVIVIIGNLFKIAGSAMYFLPYGPNFLVASRFVVGLGSGTDSSLLSMISRSSTKNERTSLMSYIYAGRQAGLILGPACNFFLRYFNFSLGSIHINQFTAPGFFLTIVWCVHTVLVFLFYYDLEYLEDEESEVSSNSNNSSSSKLHQSTCGFLKEIFLDLISEECIVLLGLSFTFMFVQVGVEALITPLSYELFEWKDLKNSIYYSVTGILYVIALLSLSKLSKFVSDRFLVLFGLTFVTANNIMFLVFVIFAFDAKGAPWVEAIFILYGVVLCIPLAYALVPLLSLFTKVTSSKNQGFNQGVRMVCAKLGQIMGPLWSSYLLSNLILVTSVNVGLLLLFLVMFVTSYNRFPGRDRESSFHEYENSEEKPLLEHRQHPEA